MSRILNSPFVRFPLEWEFSILMELYSSISITYSTLSNYMKEYEMEIVRREHKI